MSAQTASALASVIQTAWASDTLTREQSNGTQLAELRHQYVTAQIEIEEFERRLGLLLAES